MSYEKFKKFFADDELLEKFIAAVDDLCLRGDRETWLIAIAKFKRVMPTSLRDTLQEPAEEPHE